MIEARCCSAGRNAAQNLPLRDRVCETIIVFIGVSEGAWISRDLKVL